MGKHRKPNSILAAGGETLVVGSRVQVEVNSISLGEKVTHAGSVTDIEYSHFWDDVGANVRWDDPRFDQWDKGEVYLSKELHST